MTQSTTDTISYKNVKKTDIVGRRTRLRQFQAQLTERVQAARTGADQRSRQLGVMIGNLRCLLDLQQVSEVMPVGRISRVPLTHDWYLGLTSVRGNLIGVIDFARFQGQALTEPAQESRIVVFSPGLSFNCGLLVSRVLGLRNVDEMELQAQAGDSELPWEVRRYQDRESNAWVHVDLAQVVQDPRFLHVGL